MNASFFAFSGLINALASFVLVFFVLIKKNRSDLDKRFLWFSFSVGYWAINYFFWLQSHEAGRALFWIRNAMCGAILIPATFLHLVFNLVEKETSSKRFIVTGYLLSAFFLFFSFSPYYISSLEQRLFFKFWPVPSLLFHLMLAHFSLSVLYAHILMWSAIKRTGGNKRNQIQYVFVGTLVGFVGGCTNYLLWYGIPIPPYLNLLVTVYIVTIAYAIARYGLMDIKVAITRTGIFILVYAFLVGLPILLTLSNEAFLANLFGRRWWLIPLLFCTLMASIGPFVYLILQRKAEAVLLKEQKAYQQILLQASKGMTLIKDLNHLLKLMAYILTKTIRITHARIFLWDSEGKQFICKAIRGDHRRQGSDVMSETAALIQHIREIKEPLVLEEIRVRGVAFLRLSDEVVLEMEKLDAAVVVPSFVQDRLLGFVVLGDKKSKRLYTESDLDTLTTLANQAALAIENCIFLTAFEHQQTHFFQTAKMADLGTMASGIAHQMNNRFHMIKLGVESALMTELIKLREHFSKNGPKAEGEMIESLTHVCERIAKSADHGGEIVRRLLDFSRLSEGFKPVNLREAATNCMRLWECKRTLSDIDFRFEIPDGLVRIHGNFSEIEEILFNLLDNAYDALKMKEEAWAFGTLEKPEHPPRGSIILTAKETFWRDKRCVEIVITDTGLGMTDAAKKQVFVPFFTTKATAIKGTGLGLYVIRRMVDAHQGDIVLESEYGKGTTFRVFIPAVAEV